MPKKIACWVSNRWTAHLETDIEIIARHVTQGDDVTVYVCSGELSTCYSNLEHSEEACKGCIARRRNGFELAGITDKVKIRDLANLTADDQRVLERYRGLKFNSVEELFAVELDNCKLGHAVFNELVGIKKNNNPDILAEAEYLSKAVEMAALVYLSFKSNLTQNRPDCFYSFNQRFAITRPAVDAAIALGITYHIHERAGVPNRYWVTENSGIHSLDYWKEQVQRVWDESAHSDEEKVRMAERWYDDRAAGMDQGWFSFTAEQKAILPPGFDPNKTNVVIFNSSEWELLGLLDDYNLELYESQGDALLQIASDLENSPDVEIYLRVHPHLKGKVNKQTEFIEERLTSKFRNFHVIGAASEISTYLLLAQSSVVVTFGSTVGIEAAYHRKPSLLLGRSRYEDLGACDVPKTHAEVVSYITERRFVLSAEDLDARRSKSLKYAYMYQAGGIPYEFFEQTGVYDIKFKGSDGSKIALTEQAPSFESGLESELRSRVELTREHNPLAGTVRELVETVHELKEKIAELEQQRDSQQKLLSDISNSRAWKIARELQVLKSKLIQV